MIHRNPVTDRPTPRHGESPLPSPDSRWHCLRLVQRARAALGLKDRDIAVLRGLMSLVRAGDWGEETIVFASNRVISERCDGLEERTLRRRLVRLEERGLVLRRPSPNGKRYRVRDEAGAVVLTYGIDLAPLVARLDEIERRAAEADQSAARLRALKARLRHRLGEISRSGEDISPEACAESHRALRRKASAKEIAARLESLSSASPDPETPTARENAPTRMTATGGQNDRDIQSSESDDHESERAPELSTSSMDKRTGAPDEIGFDECIQAATTAIELAGEPPRGWSDLHGLARTLAPAIGLEPRLVSAAIGSLGYKGGSLAILGLVQSHGRIRKPAAYLTRLIERSGMGQVDCARMFRSLTRRPAAG